MFRNVNDFIDIFKIKYLLHDYIFFVHSNIKLIASENPYFIELLIFIRTSNIYPIYIAI